jgi:hypothetical protein
MVRTEATTVGAVASALPAAKLRSAKNRMTAGDVRAVEVFNLREEHCQFVEIRMRFIRILSFSRSNPRKNPQVSVLACSLDVAAN